MHARVICVVVLLGAMTVACVPPAAPSPKTQRVSVSSDGTQGNDWSVTGNRQAMSADGRYIAYSSNSTMLVQADTNASADIFVFDRRDRTTTRVSVATDGTQSSGDSRAPALSADGRYVTYYSWASNLVAGDTNGVADVFVFDRRESTTTRVSVATDGAEADDHSWTPAISADGRYVTYSSGASNLAAGDTNGFHDVFVSDRLANSTSRVSGAFDGGDSDGPSTEPAISADGRFISFVSEASNLVEDDGDSFVDVFVSDRWTQMTTRVSVAPDGSGVDGYFASTAISADGRFVVAEGEMPRGNPGTSDIFLFDRSTGESTRVSVSPAGTPGNGASLQPAISADGRFVTYSSLASNLVRGVVGGVEGVFLFDRLQHTTSLVSVASGGRPGNGSSTAPAISGDGRYVAYTSWAVGLVPEDTNGVPDVFLFDRHR